MDAKYKPWFFIMPAAFLAGICLGSLSALKIDVSAFFSTASQSLASPTLCMDSFLKAFRQNMGYAILLCIFGTTVVGALPSAVLLAIRGYGLGQTVGALISAFGFRGFWSATFGIFPHNLFYVPFLCLMSIFGAGFSASLLGKDHNPRRRLVSYFLTALILTVPIVLGCLIEGYVSAPLMRNILTPNL